MPELAAHCTRIPPVPNLVRRSDLLAVSFLTVVFLIYFGDVLLGLQDFFIRDLARYYHPTKSILRSIVLGGEFPWWNPFYSAGQPMAANPEYEVFYPLQWLILLPDFATGYRLHILVHVWITAVGMYALLRSMRLGVAGALFGAVSWGFGGVTLSLINLLPILFAAAWLPLILLFVRRCLRRFSWRDAGLAAMAGGMQILVGEPTTLVQTWLMVGFYALWRIARLHSRGWRAWVDPTLIIAVVLAGSIAIGAVQLFPAADHAGETVRARGFDLGLVTAWSFPPQRLLELGAPHLFGRVDADGRTLYWAGGGLYGKPASPFLFSVYQGLAVFALFVAALVTRRSGRGLWFLFILPFFTLALGRHTPLYEWLDTVGVGIPFRYPEKFMLAVLFATVVLASAQFGRVVRGNRIVARRAAGVVLVVGLSALAVIGLMASPFYERWFTELWGLGQSRFRGAMLEVSRIDWIVVLGTAATTGAIFWLRARGRIERIWAPLLIALLAAELFPVALDTSPRIQRRFYELPPLVRSVSEVQTEYRIFHEVDWYGRTETARKWFSTGRGVYWVVRNGLFPMTPANAGLRTVLERDYDRTALLPTVDLVQSMWDVRDRGQKEWARIFMQMSNARYRSRYLPFEGAVARAGGDLRNLEPVEMVDVGEHPRYYFADRLVRVTSREAFVDALVETVPSPRSAFVTFDPYEVRDGEIVSVSETSSSIRLEVEPRGPSFLVLSVTPHRYWRARIDGRPAELRVTNVGYQGVVLNEGDRVVELVYRNPVIEATAPVSAGSFLLAIVAVLFGKDRRSRDGRRAETSPDSEQVDQHSSGVAPDRHA